MSAHTVAGCGVGEITCSLVSSNFDRSRLNALPADVVLLIQRAGNQPLPEKDRHQLARHGSFLFFTVKRCQCSDNGMYKCLAVNTTTGEVLAKQNTHLAVPSTCHSHEQLGQS